MGIYLHACSALPLLERIGCNWPSTKGDKALTSFLRIDDLMGIESTMRQLAFLRLPVHVLTSEPRTRNNNDWIAYHCWNRSLPESAFLRLAPDVYASTPEFCFLQLATKLTRIELVRLGYELCATYLLDPRNSRGFIERNPLTTVEKLRAFAEGAPDCTEKRRAEECLQWVAGRSASPRETITAMMASLPSKMGGWGFAVPKLNHEVKVGHGVRRIDLYWPERGFGLEYDSDEEHAGAEDIARDSRREKEIELQGIRLARITNGELKSESGRELLRRTLCSRLGRSVQAVSATTEWARRRLAMTLLAPHATMV